MTGVGGGGAAMMASVLLAARIVAAQPQPGDPLPPPPVPGPAQTAAPATTAAPAFVPDPVPTPQPLPPEPATAAPAEPAAPVVTGTFDPNAGQMVMPPAFFKRQGFLAEADVGIGSCSGKLCSADDFSLGLDLGIDVAGLYRFSPPFAVGAEIRYTTLAIEAGSGDDDVDGSASYTMYGVVGRYYFVPGDAALDPWAGAGIGLVDFSLALDGQIGGSDFSLDATLSGTYFDLGGGLDYHVNDSLAVGVAAHYVLVSWGEACFDSGAADEVCVDDDGSDWKEGDLPSLLGLVAGIRYYF